MKTIEVSDELFDRLEEDRKEFEKTIGGNDWTIPDTINEYLKIISVK